MTGTRFVLFALALTVAVCAGLLALGARDVLPPPSNTGQVCRQPNAADCPSTAGGENGDNP